MNPMATKLTRRQLLQAGALTLAALPLRSLAGDAAQPAIISACDVGRNQHRAGLAGAGGLLTLPERGHHLELDLARPDECLVFARRPGYQIARFNWRSGQQLAWSDYPDNRHGFGHGILAHGQLYTTDNDIDNGNGLLTVRDPHTLLSLREMARINHHHFAVALQSEGEGAPPLVASWNAEQCLRLMDAPDAL